MADVLLNGLDYESKQTSAVQPIIFTAQESQLMVPIMERKTPQDVARQWLRDPSEDLQRWLAGRSAAKPS